MSAHIAPENWLANGFQLHPALADSHALGFFTDRSLFDPIFEDERFQEWQSELNSWQLRFTGSPGCGKTTLSSLIVERLRNQCSDDNAAVAGIYLQQDVTSYEGLFAEDFLRSIFSQLVRSIELCDPVDAYRVDYAKYLRACEQKQRCSFRTRLIRNALHALVPKLKRAFVIVDDIDRCSTAALLFAEEELSNLQGRGVKIMTTSRIPWFDEPWELTTCNGRECIEERPGKAIHMYWVCEDCCKDPDEEEGITAFCNACWRQKAGCIRCDNYTRFSQPYEHVDFNISQIGDSEMYRFVRRAIEEEHGDVGLAGLYPDNQSFTSTFGRQLKQSGKAEQIVDDIVDRSHKNIALAIKRLELLHRVQSVETFLAAHDRLPASIVEMFDASLSRIESQATNERLLGLQAIAVVGRHENGVTFDEFQRLTHLNSEDGRVNRKQISYRSLDDVLHAAKGFVIREDEPLVLKAWHPDFRLYSHEHYHPLILWANNSLTKSSEAQSGLKRAQTFNPGEGRERGTELTTRRSGKAPNAKQITKRWTPQKYFQLKEEEEKGNKNDWGDRRGGFASKSKFGFHRSATFQGL